MTILGEAAPLREAVVVVRARLVADELAQYLSEHGIRTWRLNQVAELEAFVAPGRVVVCDEEHAAILLQRPIPPALVVLLDRPDPTSVIAYVRRGVAAVVDTAEGLHELLAAVEATSDGDTWLPRSLVGPVLSRLASPQTEAGSVLAGLTPREREVLELVEAGMDRAQVARRLVVSEHTVRTHLQNLMRKLGAHSQLEAAAILRRERRAAGGGDVPLRLS